MLATTKHETAHTFRAIEEYGKGNGRNYGKEVIVTNPATKKIYKNKIDYYNARRVINGTDKAITIAGYAEDLEILLLISTR